MKKKIIPFNKPYLAQNIKDNLLKVISKRKFSDGDFQKLSENYIKKLINSKSIKLTQSCSSALEVSMILANIKKGDEVIMPSFTFTSTANCVLLRGAKPIFVDINENDVNLNIDLIEKKISKKTKAVIAVHYGGVSCDMDKLIKLKKKYNFLIIEDAAHAFYGKYKNKYLGTIGDLGAFSFHETKNIVGGQCGALSINNPKYIKRANIILDKGTDRHYMGKKNYYSWVDIGSEYRAPELSAALVYSQLINLKEPQNKRKQLWNNYYNSIKKIDSRILTTQVYNKKKIQSAFHIFCIIFKSKKIRENFASFMKKKGVLCFFHYYPLHLSRLGKKLSKTKLNITEKIFNGLVRLPLYPDLKLEEQKKIINNLMLFIKKNHFL